jgi:hypothetical protein
MIDQSALVPGDLQADLVPEREALGFIDIATITAVNLAIAVNAGNLGAPVSGTAMAGLDVGVTQL